MRLRVISDVHLEFMHEVAYNDFVMNFLELSQMDPCDVLVLAGDIVDFVSHQSLLTEFLTKELRECYVEVVYVLGNHEYYGKSIGDVVPSYRALCDKLNVRLLDDEYVDLIVRDEVLRVYGGTLWSNLKFSTYLLLKILEKSNMSYDEMYNNWQRSMSKLSQHATSDKCAQLIITHYVPSHELVSPEYRTNTSFNDAYYVKCDHLFNNNPHITHWIYGHSHYRDRRRLGDVEFIANPYGYAHEYYDVKDNIRAYNCVVEVEGTKIAHTLE